MNLKAILLAVSALVASAILLTSCDNKRPPADLVMLFTGNVNGYIEPCGCVAGQIGGIDRITGYIHQEREALGDRAFFIDTGDLFAEGVIDDANEVEQLGIKAREFLKTWEHLGCDGLALGEAEASVGIGRLRNMAEEIGVPILAGNVVDSNGAFPFKPYVILERGGMKVGVFSLLAEEIRQPTPKKEVKKLKSYNLEKMLAEQGYVLQPWLERCEALVNELRPQVDVLVLASHLGFNRNVQVAQRFPQIDTIVGGHFGSVESPTTMVGNTPVLTNMIRGSRVGVMQWWLDDPSEYLANENGGVPGFIANDSLYDVAYMEADVSRQSFGDLTGMERKYGSMKWQNKRDTQVAIYNNSLEALAEMDPNPGGNRFSSNQIPMHHGVVRSEFALSAVDRFHQDTNDFWTDLAATQPRPTPMVSVFVGAESCIGCHAEQYEFWLGTRHSRAFATLEATNQETDAECIGCHTVGYQAFGGFARPGQSSGFEDVQCAACHGAGGAHMAGGANYLLRDLISEGMGGCARCHTGPHDPMFEQPNVGAERLSKVICPPTTILSPRMREAYLEGAEALKERKFKNWDLISQAYSRVGEDELAFEAARSWVGANPMNMNARLNLAERALNLEMFDSAIQHYRLVCDVEPDNPRGWTGLAFALFNSNPEESLKAAREAYALDPDTLLPASILAMNLMQVGMIEEAREHMERHLSFHPEQAPGLEHLLVQLPESQ
jgi:tetratricopeptide (TPR) repeat protein